MSNRAIPDDEVPDNEIVDNEISGNKVSGNIASDTDAPDVETPDGDNSLHPYQKLTPELVLDAIESTGLITDLRIYPLNSYENRVYQIGIEGSEPIIAKFYRPQRWSDEQILEEHEFCQQLVEADVPVVAPQQNSAGETLLDFQGFKFSLYERRGGRAPDLGDLDSLHILGRLVARIHAVGATQDFKHRPHLDIESFGSNSHQFISENFIPMELATAYNSLCEDLLGAIKELFAQVPYTAIRTHGDCHAGNILWRDDSPHFVDLDDARMAPAIQDIWMFLSGDRQQQTAQLSELADGYNQFYDFDPRQLPLAEALRSLRIMHYSAWLARRWQDPAFPHNFPWFNTVRYWSEHVLELREQWALLNEPPLQVF
ncbi:serine/threonine protein kinase [Dasania marina]|uniref:serine/threonine protein kinase n=1 Tax=Dasania marina TaxID=471499 RepID=UPI00038184C2|nr:serine/threonine protein kinase [Dasania marina]